MAKQSRGGKISRRIQEQIQILRAQGHVVNVYHVRHFAIAGGSAVNEYMTHKQYNQRFDGAPKHAFATEASAIGGYTEIEIKKDGVVTARGKFNQNLTNLCRINGYDNAPSFNRRIGFQYAWGQAVKSLLGRQFLKALRLGE